jgi:acyl-CoA reductase-like NAD-dependent aldehyde dehydrogenase
MLASGNLPGQASAGSRSAEPWLCPEAITVTERKVAFIKSTSLTRVHRPAERLKAGGVYVNGARPNLAHTSFGGLGISGYGKEGGWAGIDEFPHSRTVSIIEAQ